MDAMFIETANSSKGKLVTQIKLEIEDFIVQENFRKQNVSKIRNAFF